MLLTSAIQLVNIGPKPSYSPLYQVVDTTSTHDASWSHIVLKQKGLALGRNFLLGVAMVRGGVGNVVDLVSGEVGSPIRRDQSTI